MEAPVFLNKPPGVSEPLGDEKTKKICADSKKKQLSPPGAVKTHSAPLPSKNRPLLSLPSYALIIHPRARLLTGDMQSITSSRYTTHASFPEKKDPNKASFDILFPTPHTLFSFFSLPSLRPPKIKKTLNEPTREPLVSSLPFQPLPPSPLVNFPLQRHSIQLSKILGDSW